ncbi:kinase-like protein [Sistotremastrum niveocremeum HHB9708]|nr:kinase-like protein [Sistotremastrum niveocremeum HHB9708]
MNDPFAHGSYGFVHRGLLDGYDGASARMEVAIKRPNSIDMTPWARKVERFENEAKIWMLLRHPNICPFLAFIEYNSPTGNDICLVSPWSSLAAARLQTASKFAAKFRNHVFLIISGIIDGLLFMHSQEPPVLHGDVKGNNVIMFGDIDHPVPCLTDFGLSRFIQPSAVEHSVTGGNERWTAPEIIENHRQRKAILQTYTSTVPDGPKPHSAPELELTEKSDVWSLAMTIIELITGKVPFADMPQWRVQSIFEEGPTFYAPEIQEYLRCLPMGIRQILLPCLDERPAQRPSMASVKEQWVSFLAISGGSSLDELMDEVEPSYRSYSNPDLTAWQEFIESVRKKIHNIESP